MDENVRQFRVFTRLASQLTFAFAGVFAVATLVLGIGGNWTAVVLTATLAACAGLAGKRSATIGVARASMGLALAILTYAAIVAAVFPPTAWAVIGCVLLAYLVILPYHRRRMTMRVGFASFGIGTMIVAVHVLDASGALPWPTVLLPTDYTLFLNSAGLMATMGLALVLIGQVSARLRDDARASRAASVRFEALFHSSPDGVLLMDGEGVVKLANRAAARAFRQPAHILEGVRFVDLVTPRSRPSVMEAIDAASLRGDATLPMEGVLPDGTSFPGEVAFGVWTDGPSTSHVAVVRDVSKLESALARIAADRSRSIFVTKLSHELRTPLTAILGAAHLLWESRIDEDQASKVRAILRSSDHLLGLVNDILDVSRLENATFTLLDVEVDLNLCVEQAVEIVARTAAKKDIELCYTIAADVPEAIRGDPGRIRQVTMNLLANAVKATTSGHAAVHVGMRNGLLRITVSDSGVGIPRHEQERIFEAFQQCAGTASGTGLGLTIVQGIVRGMGGSIEVESTLGEGTSFHVDLPVVAIDRTRRRPWDDEPDALAGVVCRVDMPQPVRASLEALLERHGAVIADGMDADADTLVLSKDQPAAGTWVALGTMHDGPHVPWPYLHGDVFLAVARAAGTHIIVGPAEPTTSTAARLGILLVEDVALNRILIAGMLQAQGHKVDTAEDGESAVDAAAHRAYDVVLMDINLPGMDGFAATRVIRRQGGGRPWIVGLTAHTGNTVREDCMASGMDDYLAKPCTPQGLRDCLSQRAVVRDV